VGVVVVDDVGGGGSGASVDVARWFGRMDAP
jgi:hypothetical protein